MSDTKKKAASDLKRFTRSAQRALDEENKTILCHWFEGALVTVAVGGRATELARVIERSGLARPVMPRAK